MKVSVLILRIPRVVNPIQTIIHVCTYLHAYGNEGINLHSDGGTCAAVGESYECQ